MVIKLNARKLSIEEIVLSYARNLLRTPAGYLVKDIVWCINYLSKFWEIASNGLAIYF